MCTALRKCALCLPLLQNGKMKGIERIAYHTLSDVKQYAAQWVCDCSTKPALQKSKQPLSKGRMFLTCCKRECNFFTWIDQPMSRVINKRLSYSPQS